MPGIFISNIISNRTGLNSSDSLGKRGICRKRGSTSCIQTSKYSSGSSRTESSYGSIYDSDRPFTSIHSDSVRSQGSDASSKTTSTVSATAKSANRTAKSRGFYSNKKHNAMIFCNKTDDNDLNSNDCGRERKRRQYQPSRSSSPCEWGYFVDTV